MRNAHVPLVSLLVVVVAACGHDEPLPEWPDAGAAADAGIDSATDAPGRDDVALAVTLAGTGTGTITSAPAGIDCGTTCSASYPRDTIVTLTAVPATGSVFGGWTGACAGSAPTC